MVPQYKNADVHLAGLKIKSDKKKLWRGSLQQQSGSRCLLANEMGKSNKHPLLKAKVVTRSSKSQVGHSRTDSRNGQLVSRQRKNVVASTEMVQVESSRKQKQEGVESVSSSYAKRREPNTSANRCKQFRWKFKKSSVDAVSEKETGMRVDLESKEKELDEAKGSVEEANKHLKGVSGLVEAVTSKADSKERAKDIHLVPSSGNKTRSQV
ncbi:hypothetical protein Droror1_Dr00008574 [Drosera rotundifolia]